MIGLWTLLTISASLFHLIVSIPGLISKDLHPPTRTNTQDVSKGAQAGYLLPVSGGLNSRRLLWFWGKDEEEGNGSDGAPYNDGVITTKRPSIWSRFKSKVKAFGTDIKDGVKDAANSTKWAFKKAGRKVKDTFKKGIKKIKMKFMSAEDRLNHFANRLKAQAEKGNQKAIRLLQKLGIIAHVEDGKVIRVDVEDEIDSVSNILKEEGVLKVISTTNLVTATSHYIITDAITKSVPSTENYYNDILSTSNELSTPEDIMSNLRSTNLPNFSTVAHTTTTESAKTTAETPLSTTEAAKTTTETPLTTTEAAKTTTETPFSTTEASKTTTETPKTIIESIKSTIKISTAQVSSTEPPKTITNIFKATTETPKPATENVITIIQITTAQTTTTETSEPTTEIAKTTTKTPKTTETPKATLNASSIEQPFKTDSPSILESSDEDKDAFVEDKDVYVDSSSMDEDKDDEFYTPPPFPDVFGDNRVKNRLMELYEKGDFTHSELADLFDPDYYDYYYDYNQ